MHVGLAAAAISLLVAGVAAGSASASAYGVQYWGFSEWAHITTAGTHRTCSLVNGRRRSCATPACVFVWL
jgi:hypothetical protein